MRLLPFAALWITALAVASAQSSAPAGPTSAPPKADAASIAPKAPASTAPKARPAAGALPPADPGFVKQYCATCHNERAKVAGLVLDPAAVDQVGADPAVWE